MSAQHPKDIKPHIIIMSRICPDCIFWTTQPFCKPAWYCGAFHELECPAKKKKRFSILGVKVTIVNPIVCVPTFISLHVKLMWFLKYTLFAVITSQVKIYNADDFAQLNKFGIMIAMY